MKKFAAYILALTLPLTMMACSKSNSSAGNDPANNIDEAAKEPDLQNKIFRGECSLKPLEAIASGIATAGNAVIKGAREQYQIVGANITHATLLYTSADCTGTESLIFKEYGTISISQDQRSADGGRFVDITNTRLVAQAADDAGVLVANEVKLCGVEDWGNKEERDVTAPSAEVNCYRRVVPNSDANLYLLEGNTLYFGERGIFDKKSERPDNIDRNTKFVAN